MKARVLVVSVSFRGEDEVYAREFVEACRDAVAKDGVRADVQLLSALVPLPEEEE